MFAKRRRLLLYFVLLIAILVALWVQWSRLIDPFTIQDDFRKFHWMLRFEDPELFSNDPLTGQSIAEVRLGSMRLFIDEVRPGYSLLFFLASPLFPPVLFNKLLIFPLLLLSVYFLFRIGEITDDPVTGFFLAITFIVLTALWTSSISVAAGLPRSFMAPFLLGIVFFLMTDRYWIATGIALIAATIYLPAAVLGLLTIALATFEPSTSPWRYRIIWRRFLPLVAFLILLILIMPTVAERIQEIWTSLIEQEWPFGTILQDPNFKSEGRWPLFKDSPFMGHGGLVNHSINLWLLIVLTLLSAGIYLLRPQSYRRFPRILKLLLLASIILYISAWLAIFLTSSLALYFPSRYTRFSLVLVLLLFVVMNLGPALRIFWARINKLERSLKVVIVITVAVAVTAIFLLVDLYDLWGQLGATGLSFKVILPAVVAFLVGSSSIVLIILFDDVTTESEETADRLFGRAEFSIFFTIILAAIILAGIPPDNHHFLTIEPPLKDLITFFQTTPKDSTTAGDPCALDFVPIAAGRQILFSCEYYSRNATDQILDNFRAYYADSLSEVRDFCEAKGIDYIVVESAKFNATEAPWAFSELFNNTLYPQLASQAGYVLEDIPQSLRVYDDENFVVMMCNPDDFRELARIDTQVEGLGILAYNEVSETISQAGEVEVIIKWAADEEMLVDYDVCFSIIDRSGASKQKVCEPLSPRLPTSQWQIPEIRYETYHFRISPYLDSGNYSIVASVRSEKEINNGDGIVIGEIAYTASPRIISKINTNPHSAYDVIWGDMIALADFDVSESESNALTLNLRWQALKRMHESYKVFAHLRKPDTNDIVAQMDSVPRNWTYPTDWWEANEIVADTLSIPLPELEPGEFELWLGLYHEESGERLPLIDPDSLDLPTRKDAVMIYEFEQSAR